LKQLEGHVEQRLFGPKGVEVEIIEPKLKDKGDDKDFAYEGVAEQFGRYVTHPEIKSDDDGDKDEKGLDKEENELSSRIIAVKDPNHR